MLEPRQLNILECTCVAMLKDVNLKALQGQKGVCIYMSTSLFMNITSLLSLFIIAPQKLSLVVLNFLVIVNKLEYFTLQSLLCDAELLICYTIVTRLSR